ncbi:hypothetical protein VPH35_005963 [Triticum aestivum]
MDNSPQPIMLFIVLLLGSILKGVCFHAIEEQGNSTISWPYEIHPEFFLPKGNLTSDKNSKITYFSSHTWPSGGGNKHYYGAEATLDVYGFDLQNGQESASMISILYRGDGQPYSLNGIQIGWHDSRTHFYTAWISGGTSGKGCMNMICPGCHKTSSSIAPGNVIGPLSCIGGQKRYITLRILRYEPAIATSMLEKYSGDWHIHFGAMGDPKPVGYFPKSLIPGLVDKPLEITFGGYVNHKKPRLSPPMGSGYISASGNVASFSNLKLIDADGISHIVNIDLPSTDDGKGCYTPSKIDSAQFFYGGSGCVD